MSATEIFLFYGAPWTLVAGAALLAWRNHVAVRRSRERDAKLTNVERQAN